jgi:hypothetical protein
VGAAVLAGSAAAAVAVPLLLLGAAAAAPSAGAGFGPQVPPQFHGDLLAAAARCPRIGPSVLAAQLAAESAWDPAAQSPAGAQGIAQFMPGTWARWGGDHDEDGTASPFDPGDAIRAQADYLCHLLDQVAPLAAGDREAGLRLALAAYNAGPGAVLAAGDVPPFPETRMYVDRVLAAAAGPGYALTGGGTLLAGGADALLPAGYRNGASAEEAVASALGQVGVWRDAGYCLRFVEGRYRRPWDGAPIGHARQVWENAPPALHRPRDFAAPRGSLVLWSGAIGRGSGHIGISLGDGTMVSTTGGAVAILPVRGYADHAYLGWMPPYFVSRPG